MGFVCEIHLRSTVEDVGISALQEPYANSAVAMNGVVIMGTSPAMVSV